MEPGRCAFRLFNTANNATPVNHFFSPNNELQNVYICSMYSHFVYVFILLDILPDIYWSFYCPDDQRDYANNL